MPRGTRKKQETPRAEDYLETVYHLIEDKGFHGILAASHD